MSHALSVAVFALLMVPGAFLVFVPTLPSLSYMFVLALVFSIMGKFAVLSPVHLLILAVLWVAAILVDTIAGLVGAKIGGASVKSVVGGGVGGVLGFGLFPPLGIFLGIFLGVILAELSRHRTFHQALRAGLGGLIGSAAGMLVNFVIALTFITLFVVYSW